MAVLPLLAAACYKDGTDFVDEGVRIVVSPKIPIFNADGTTVNGDESFIGAVKIRKGSSVADLKWTAEPATDVSWVEVKPASFVSQYTSTDGKENYEVAEEGFEIVVNPNHSYRRSFDLCIKVEDGTSATYTVTQLGEKEDASIECAVTAIDIPCVGGETEVYEYTTNMNKYSYSIAYDGDQKDWLTVLDKGLGKFALKAEAWSSETADRKATLTIIAGTESTSIAKYDIAVTQLRYDIYYYLYGPSLGLDRSGSISMTKKEKGVYTLNAFFFDAGTNAVCFNKDSRSETYPVYYLAADGTIKSSDKAVTSSDLAISANGLYKLTADFNTMTWTMERSIKCVTCMPDSELAKYPTKDYPTAAGGYKTWMTVSLHWNGGSTMGTLKLGSGLVGQHQTGGYGTPSDKTVPYDTRNSAYDTEENGGSVKEVYDADGTPLADKFGRLYSAYEYLLGTPKGCLNDAYQMGCPYGEPGDKYTDDAGLSFELENILIANLSNYEGNAAGDASAEADHPSLKMQIQGICPFGWHIANMQDWKDLIYAASKASAGTDKVVPEDNACYKAMAGGTITNFASMLYSKEWFDWTKSAKGGNRSSAADAFGWNMFVQGWRLYATGYDYGPGDETPRFYAAIPLMGQYTNSKKAFWRAYVTSESVNMTMNDGCDIGNGCGTAVRCVKNYNTK